MIISITSSRPTPEQAEEISAFLAKFLPRLKQQQPGVAPAYHFTRPESGESTTIIVWESREALRAYREGELIKEAIDIERRLGEKTTRESYPLSVSV